MFGIGRQSGVRAKWQLLALILVVCSVVQTVHAEDWVYTVRPGDSLWKISNDYLISPEYWVKVQELNGVRKTRQLAPGTRLTIPVAWLKQHPASAQVMQFKGDIQLVRESKAKALAGTQKLRRGDAIRTGKNSSISLGFSDGSRVTIFSDSEVYLDALEAQKDKGLTNTSIKLIRGRVESKVKPQGKGSRYQIDTPAAVAAVRGTEFRVSADADGELMRSEVLTGMVGVSGSGVTQEVGAGYATVTRLGSPPMAPRRLPAAPDLQGLAKLGAASSVSFRWPQQAGIEQYRAQLALDEMFSRLVAESLLQGPAVTWTELVPAHYYMRVRAVDELGLEGFNALHQFVVTEPLRAPSPITPGDGIELKKARPFIAWSNVSAANFYVLQLARDAAFSEDLSEISGLVNNNFKLAEALADGEYFWRVKSMSKNGGDSAFSAVRRFVIKTH